MMEVSIPLYALLVLFPHVMIASCDSELLSEIWTDTSNEPESRSDLANSDADTIIHGDSVKFINKGAEHKQPFLRVATSEASVQELGTEIDNLDSDSVLQSSDNKRNVGQYMGLPGSRTCARAHYLCHGMHHPQCSVQYQAPTSTLSSSMCRLNVRCNYTSDFEYNSGVCFAANRAFPSPLHPNVNRASLQYSFSLKLRSDTNLLLSEQARKNKTEAMMFVQNKITQYANSGLAKIDITTNYRCAHMTPCTLTL